MYKQFPTCGRGCLSVVGVSLYLVYYFHKELFPQREFNSSS